MRSKLDSFHTFGDPMESVLENTVINGETIPAFNIGGEYRLCLPRILRQILSQYHWEQVIPILVIYLYLAVNTEKYEANDFKQVGNFSQL